MLKRRVIRDPKKEALTFGGLLLAAVAIFFAVLNYKTQQRLSTSAETTEGPLQYSLTMPSETFAPGAPIPIRLQVRNVGRDIVLLKFDQELEFDVVVKRDVNLIFATVPFDVWRYSAAHPGGPKAHDRQIKPGGTLEYKIEWPQVDFSNEQVSEGRYVIVGVLNRAGGKKVMELRGGKDD